MESWLCQFSVIPTPYQVRGKLQWESRNFITKMMKNWIPVSTGMTFCGFSEATTFGGGRSPSSTTIIINLGIALGLRRIPEQWLLLF
jgi:hypothetical protein